MVSVVGARKRTFGPAILAIVLVVPLLSGAIAPHPEPAAPVDERRAALGELLDFVESADARALAQVRDRIAPGPLAAPSLLLHAHGEALRSAMLAALLEAPSDAWSLDEAAFAYQVALRTAAAHAQTELSSSLMADMHDWFEDGTPPASIHVTSPATPSGSAGLPVQPLEAPAKRTASKQANLNGGSPDAPPAHPVTPSTDPPATSAPAAGGGGLGGGGGVGIMSADTWSWVSWQATSTPFCTNCDTSITSGTTVSANMDGWEFNVRTVNVKVRAYDVDVAEGEVDKVFYNGVQIGTLTGSSNTWSITTISVPVSYFQDYGSNSITVTVSPPGYYAEIDYIALEAETNSIITITTPVVTDRTWYDWGESMTVTYTASIGSSFSQNLPVEIYLLDPSGTVQSSYSHRITLSNAASSVQTVTLYVPWSGTRSELWKVDVNPQWSYFTNVKVGLPPADITSLTANARMTWGTTFSWNANIANTYGAAHRVDLRVTLYDPYGSQYGSTQLQSFTLGTGGAARTGSFTLPASGSGYWQVYATVSGDSASTFPLVGPDLTAATADVAVSLASYSGSGLSQLTASGLMRYNTVSSATTAQTSLQIYDYVGHSTSFPETESVGTGTGSAAGSAYTAYVDLDNSPTVTYTVDTGSNVNEAIESNNQATKAFTLSGGTSVTSLTTTASAYAFGDTVSLTFRVQETSGTAQTTGIAWELVNPYGTTVNSGSVITTVSSSTPYVSTRTLAIPSSGVAGTGWQVKVYANYAYRAVSIQVGPDYSVGAADIEATLSSYSGSGLSAIQVRGTEHHAYVGPGSASLSTYIYGYDYAGHTDSQANTLSIPAGSGAVTTPYAFIDLDLDNSPTLEFYADYTGAIQEVSESNNYAAKAFTLSSTSSVYAYSTPDSWYAFGATIPVDIQVRETSGTGKTTGISWELANPSGTIVASGSTIATVSSSTPWSARQYLTAPSSGAVGSGWTVRVSANYDHRSIPVTLGPDLSVDGDAITATLTQFSGSGKSTVRASGSVDHDRIGPGAATVQVRLVGDDSLGNTATNTQSRTFPAGSGSVATSAFDYELDLDAAPTLHLTADSGTTLAEVSEGNNFVETPFTLSTFADVYAAATDATSYAFGAPVSVTFTIKDIAPFGTTVGVAWELVDPAGTTIVEGSTIRSIGLFSPYTATKVLTAPVSGLVGDGWKVRVTANYDRVEIPVSLGPDFRVDAYDLRAHVITPGAPGVPAVFAPDATIYYQTVGPGPASLAVTASVVQGGVVTDSTSATVSVPAGTGTMVLPPLSLSVDLTDIAYLRVELDPANAIAERSEANNVAERELDPVPTVESVATKYGDVFVANQEIPNTFSLPPYKPSVDDFFTSATHEPGIGEITYVTYEVVDLDTAVAVVTLDSTAGSDASWEKLYDPSTLDAGHYKAQATAHTDLGGVSPTVDGPSFWVAEPPVMINYIGLLGIPLFQPNSPRETDTARELVYWGDFGLEFEWDPIEETAATIAMKKYGLCGEASTAKPVHFNFEMNLEHEMSSLDTTWEGGFAMGGQLKAFFLPKPVGGKAPISLSGEVDIEWEFENGEFSYDSATIGVAAEISFSCEISKFIYSMIPGIGQVLAYLNIVGLGVDAGGGLDLSMTLDEDMDPLFDFLPLRSAQAGITLEGGLHVSLGATDWARATLSAYGQLLRLEGQYDRVEDDFCISEFSVIGEGMDLALKGEIDFWWFTAEKTFWTHTIGGDGLFNYQNCEEEGGMAPMAMRSMAPAAAPSLPGDLFELIPGAQPASMALVASGDVLVDGAPGNRTVVSLGIDALGNVVVVHDGDNPAHATTGMPDVAQIVRKDGTWTSGFATGGARLDAQPSVAVAPTGQAVAAWIQIEHDLATTDNPFDYLNQTRIHVASRGPLGEWTVDVPVYANPGNTSFQSRPRVVMDSSGTKAAVAWLEHPDGTYTGPAVPMLAILNVTALATKVPIGPVTTPPVTGVPIYDPNPLVGQVNPLPAINVGPVHIPSVWLPIPPLPIVGVPEIPSMDIGTEVPVGSPPTGGPAVALDAPGAYIDSPDPAFLATGGLAVAWSKMHADGTNASVEMAQLSPAGNWTHATVAVSDNMPMSARLTVTPTDASLIWLERDYRTMYPVQRSVGLSVSLPADLAAAPSVPLTDYDNEQPRFYGAIRAATASNGTRALTWIDPATGSLWGMRFTPTTGAAAMQEPAEMLTGLFLSQDVAYDPDSEGFLVVGAESGNMDDGAPIRQVTM
ncbi:MAG: hypothetical protein QOD77_613 [Thermoplasmata archaeon]|nr:hypothetical protein [Thermoplasmata archaeon]